MQHMYVYTRMSRSYIRIYIYTKVQKQGWQYIACKYTYLYIQYACMLSSHASVCKSMYMYKIVYVHVYYCMC